MNSQLLQIILLIFFFGILNLSKSQSQATYQSIPVFWEVVSQTNEFLQLDSGADNTLLIRYQSKISMIYEVPEMKYIKTIPFCEHYAFLKSRDEIYCIGDQQKIYQLVNDQWVLKWDDTFKHAAADLTHDNLIVVCKDNNEIWQMNIQTEAKLQYNGGCNKITSGNVDNQFYTQGVNDTGYYYNNATQQFEGIGGMTHDISTGKDIGYVIGIGYDHKLWSRNVKDIDWRPFIASANYHEQDQPLHV